MSAGIDKWYKEVYLPALGNNTSETIKNFAALDWHSFDVSARPAKQKAFAPDYGTENFKGVKGSTKKLVVPPLQPLPITIDNFFIRTKGDFEEIENLPDGFTQIFKSKSSVYYTNSERNKVVRVSDHWGYSIRFCAWHLKGLPKINSFKWQNQYGKSQRVGIIDIDKFEPNFPMRKSAPALNAANSQNITNSNVVVLQTV